MTIFRIERAAIERVLPLKSQGNVKRHGILGSGGVGDLIPAMPANAGGLVTFIVRPVTEDQYPRKFSLGCAFRAGSPLT